MKRYKFWAAVAALCSGLAPVTAGASIPVSEKPLPFQLLIPGHYRMDELPPTATGPWFALTVSGSKASFARVQVRLHEAENPRPRGDRSMAGGIVRTDATDSVLFLIRGGQWARRDSVPTWFLGDARLSPGGSLPIRAPAPNRWTVTASPAEFVSMQAGWTFAIRIHDQVTGRSELLGGWLKGESPRFRWIGDLDGDGRLDLFVYDAMHESGATSWILYLSSQATGASILGKAAEFFTYGC